MPSVSVPISGDWLGADVDDFPGAVTGQLGWTQANSGTATIAALSTKAALAATLKFSGGVVMNPGATATSKSASELLGMTLANPYAGGGGEGIDVDFLMAIDGALSGASAYVLLLGVFDSSGAATSGNFMGVQYGFNPASGAGVNAFAVGCDTVSNLVTQGVAQYFPWLTPAFSTGQAVPAQPLSFDTPTVMQGPASPVLDVPYSIKIRIDPAWNTIRASINGQSQTIWNASSGFAVGPAFSLGGSTGITPTARFPLITNGWIGFKFIGLSLASTPNFVVDAVHFSLPGRGTQQS